MDDGDENALIVNALQRHAAIVVQKSLVEGFGLTVTEAMWKSRPMIASAVGGIQDQIVDRRDGLLITDPTDLDAFAGALVTLLDAPDLAARLGAAAHQRVAGRVPGRSSPHAVRRALRQPHRVASNRRLISVSGPPAVSRTFPGPVTVISQVTTPGRRENISRPRSAAGCGRRGGLRSARSAQAPTARAITNREVISAAVEDCVQRDRHQHRDRRGEPGLAALPAASGVQRCSARADRGSVKSLLVVSRHRATSLPAAPSARRPCHESLGTGDRRPPRGKCPVRGIDQTPRWKFRTARAGASGQRVSALGDTSRQGPALDPRCARNLYWAPVLGSGRRHVVEPSTERRSRVVKAEPSRERSMSAGPIRRSG